MPQSVLTDYERRVIGNLSIPRNVPDLFRVLRDDPNVDPGSPENIAETLAELAEVGWVTNLGDGQAQSTGELASKVDKSKVAYSMPDEKAQIFERRLAADHHAWRMVGDVWALTNDGFDKIHEPVGGTRTFSKTEIEKMIADHARLVVPSEVFEGSIHDKQGGKLTRDIHLAKGKMVENTPVATLLPEEYEAWRKAVTEEFEERTGEKLQQPMMGGTNQGYSDAWEILALDAENGKATGFQITAPWYMALTTLAVTDADTGSTLTEATGATGYARKSVAAADMNAGSGASGSVTNANAIVFAAITAGTATVIGAAKCIAATVGVMQKMLIVPSTVISSTQTPPQFAAGAFATAID